MPNYEFRCTVCNHRFSRQTSLENKDKVECPKCGSSTKQVFSTLEFLRRSCGGGFSGFG